MFLKRSHNRAVLEIKLCFENQLEIKGVIKYNMYVKKNWEKTMICFISCYRNEIGFLIRFLCDLLSSGNAGGWRRGVGGGRGYT